MAISWEEILDGTATRPCRRFYEFLHEYAIYDRIDVGLPAAYVSVQLSPKSRTTWITDEQAALMEQTLVELKRWLPYEFRVFQKYYIKGMPLRQMIRSTPLRQELMERFSWDGTIEELEYKLNRARSFIFKHLVSLTGVNNDGERNTNMPQ